MIILKLLNKKCNIFKIPSRFYYLKTGNSEFIDEFLEKYTIMGKEFIYKVKFLNAIPFSKEPKHFEKISGFVGEQLSIYMDFDHLLGYCRLIKNNYGLTHFPFNILYLNFKISYLNEFSDEIQIEKVTKLMIYLPAMNTFEPVMYINQIKMDLLDKITEVNPDKFVKLLSIELSLTFSNRVSDKNGN